MAEYDYVVLFKNDAGEWEKVIIVGKEDWDKFLAENSDARPFLKRFFDVRQTSNVSFDSYQEAEESAKLSGGSVQVVAPPKDFSDKTSDTEFYYQDP